MSLAQDFAALCSRGRKFSNVHQVPVHGVPWDGEMQTLSALRVAPFPF